MANEGFVTNSMKEGDALLDAHLETIKPQEGTGEPIQSAPPAEQPKVETPVAATPPAETPAAEPTAETTPEVPPTEAPATPEVTPETGRASYELLNEKYGTSFADDDALKNYLGQQDEIERLRGVESEFKETKTKYEEAKSQLNPRKHFVNDEEYKRQLILQKYGEDVNPAFLNKIISKDINELSDLDVLVLGKQASNPNISNPDDAVQLIYNDLRIEPNEDGKLERIDELKLSDASLSVRKELNKLKDIEIPALTDYEAEKQARLEAGESALRELEGKWDKVANKMLEGFDNYHLYEDKDGKKESYYTYAVDDDFKSMAKEAVMREIAEKGLDLTEENIRQVRGFVEAEFWHQRGDRIVSSYGKSIKASLTEAKMIEDDNPKPRNTSETPKTDADKEMESLLNYVKEDLGTTGKIKLG